MTPQEKCQQIFGRMSLAVSIADRADVKNRAKDCTVACIHQVIMALAATPTTPERLEFWQQVEKVALQL